MKGKTFLITSLVLALMLLASFAACKEATPPTPAPAPTSAPPLITKPAPTLTPVQTQAPSPKPHVSAQGRLSYVDHASLIFGTSGKVSQVNVLNGDKVTNEQLLAKLDTSTPLELAMRTTKIDLEIATDKYRKITYPYDYRTFAFDVPAAVALTGDVQRELNEAVEAMQKSGKNPEQFSGEQYWDVFSCLKRAQEALLKARENLIRGYGADVFQSGVLRMTDFWTLRAAQLEMEKAQLALDKANDDLKKAVIIAPFDGVIAKVNVKVGDFLSPGNYATTIAIELIDPSRMELDVMVNELDIPNVKLGQKVTISVDAFPDHRFEGIVTEIDSWPDAEGGLVSYEVKTSFEAPNGLAVKAGMSARADIIID